MIRLKNKLMYLLSKTINRPKVNDISKLDNLNSSIAYNIENNCDHRM